jgi:hypothetical protein
VLEFKLTDNGLEEMAKSLPIKITKEIAFNALVRAIVPTVQAMKDEAPVDDGDLRESMGFRLRRYKGGRSLFVALGPRRGTFGKHGKKPSKYAHLVENGHYTRKGKKRHWVAPNAFMRRAWLRTRESVLKNFREDFREKLGVAIEFQADKKRSRRKSQ